MLLDAFRSPWLGLRLLGPAWLLPPLALLLWLRSGRPGGDRRPDLRGAGLLLLLGAALPPLARLVHPGAAPLPALTWGLLPAAALWTGLVLCPPRAPD